MAFEKDLEFLFEIGALRFNQRAWAQYLTPNFANITEHTYRVMWLALIIAKHEKVKDLGKIIKLAIVHDLAESRGVDVHYVSRAFTTRNEEAAIKSTFKGTVLEEEFIKLWEETEEKKTVEAKIIKDADNLDIDLELLEQEASNGNRIREIHKPTRKVVYEKKLYTKTAKKLWKLIQNSDPFDWMANFTTNTMVANAKGKIK